MATTGTYVTDPNLADMADEAFERAGVIPSAIGAEHIASMRRSIGFILSSWANKGPRQWQFPTPLQHTVTTGETSFELPYGTIDVRTVTMLRDGRETEMLPMSRSDYLTLHDKTMQGRPTSYFVNRRRGTQETPTGRAIELFYWQAAENNTDIIIVSYFTQTEDVAASGMVGTFDIPHRWHEAFVSALSAKLAQKFKPEKFAELKVLADEEFRNADGEDTEKSPLIISVGYNSRAYGRR